MITSQLSTKLLKADGTAGDFDTGSRAVLVPQLGEPLESCALAALVVSGRSTEVLHPSDCQEAVISLPEERTGL